MNSERRLKISYDRRTRRGLFHIGLTNFFFRNFFAALAGWMLDICVCDIDSCENDGIFSHAVQRASFDAE